MYKNGVFVTLIIFIIMNSFSERLKTARINQDLSQAQLAKMVGVSQASIAALESGINKSTKNLLDISKALKVSPEWLYNGVDTSTSPKRQGYEVPIIYWDEVNNWKKAQKRSRHFFIFGDDFLATTYGLVVENDLMTPDFPIGTTIIVDGNKTPKNNDFVVFYDLNTETALFRQYILDGKDVYMKPLNNHYPIKQTHSDMIVCGVVIFSFRRF